MKKNYRKTDFLYGILLFSIFALFSCNEGNFASGSSTKSPSASESPSATKETNSGGTITSGVDSNGAGGGSGTNPSTGTGTNPTGGGSDPTTQGGTSGTPKGGCIKNDKVNFKWPANIQACSDSKKIFNFTTQTCTNVGSDTLYSCDFNGLNAAASEALMKTTVSQITSARDKGALLVACGEKARDGHHLIIAQWVYLPTQQSIDDCNYTTWNGAIMTVCYRRYPTTPPPACGADDEACHLQRTQECLAF